MLEHKKVEIQNKEARKKHLNEFIKKNHIKTLQIAEEEETNEKKTTRILWRNFNKNTIIKWTSLKHPKKDDQAMIILFHTHTHTQNCLLNEWSAVERTTIILADANRFYYSRLLNHLPNESNTRSANEMFFFLAFFNASSLSIQFWSMFSTQTHEKQLNLIISVR